MEELITKSKETWLTLGKEKKIKEKRSYLNLRRSIYVTRTINDGEKISKENIKIIRPGFGLEPKYFNQLIGKRVKKINKRRSSKIKIYYLSLFKIRYLIILLIYFFKNFYSIFWGPF